MYVIPEKSSLNDSVVFAYNASLGRDNAFSEKETVVIGATGGMGS